MIVDTKRTSSQDADATDTGGALQTCAMTRYKVSHEHPCPRYYCDSATSDVFNMAPIKHMNTPKPPITFESSQVRIIISYLQVLSTVSTPHAAILLA